MYPWHLAVRFRFEREDRLIEPHRLSPFHTVRFGLRGRNLFGSFPFLQRTPDIHLPAIYIRLKALLRVLLLVVRYLSSYPLHFRSDQDRKGGGRAPQQEQSKKNTIIRHTFKWPRVVFHVYRVVLIIHFFHTVKNSRGRPRHLLHSPPLLEIIHSLYLITSRVEFTHIPVTLYPVQKDIAPKVPRSALSNSGGWLIDDLGISLGVV